MTFPIYNFPAKLA